MNPVTLEITVSPTDWRHAVHVLPHQLRQWAGQVDDVQFTLNLRQRQGKYGGTGPDALSSVTALLEDLCREHRNAHVREVDYSPAMQAEVSDRFFDGRPVPLTNHDGGPFFSYFFGWHAARHDHVFHADSDILFGGGSQTWMSEALALLSSKPEVLTAAPLPGPPTTDGVLPAHMFQKHSNMGGAPQREDHDSLAYRFHGVSTRVWLFNRATLASRLQGMPLERPRLRSRVRARLEGNPAVELPEKSMSRRMNQLGLRRVDFLSADPGMWTLHPTMRSEEFYDALETLIRRVETGDIPDEQRGDFDVNDSLVDWTSARENLRRKRGMQRFARAALASVRHRSR